MENKNWLIKYWHFVTTIILVVFNVGYTYKSLETKATKEEVKQEIVTALNTYDQTLKNNYVEINKIPGLSQSLESLQKSIEELNSRLDKLDDRLYRNGK